MIVDNVLVTCLLDACARARDTHRLMPIFRSLQGNIFGHPSGHKAFVRQGLAGHAIR